MDRAFPGCRAALVATALLVSAGCAGWSVTDVSTGVEGYEVFEPYPYLLVTDVVEKGETRGWTFDVVWLPNRAKRYRVRSWAGLGKSDFRFTFEDGWMFTGLEAASDGSAVLQSLLALAKPLVPSASEARPDGAAPPAPRLYRLEFGDDGLVHALTPVDLGAAR